MGTQSAYPRSVVPGIPRLGRKPKGWREVAFGDVLEVVKRPATIDPDQSYQLINVKRNRGGVIPRETKRGSEIKTQTQFYVEADDFVISRRQIVHGACGIVPSKLDGALVSNEYSTLVPKNGLCLDFLACFSHTSHFQKTCFHASVGVVIEKMIFNLGDWLKYRFYLPPLEEQERIVRVLAAADRAIARTEDLIAAKQKLKDGLSWQLITGKCRLPEFDGVWTSGSLGELAVISMGSSPPSSSYNDHSDGLPLIQGNADTSNRRSAPRMWTSVITTTCEVGDILLSVRAPVGEISISDHNACVGRGMASIRARPHCSQSYLYQALLMFESQWLRLSQGSTFTAINSNDLRSLRIELPEEIAEQEAIAEVLGVVDRQVEILECKLAALYKLKKGLVQRLVMDELCAEAN